MQVAIVSAETFEFDSRGLRIARALAEDGHHVHILALPGDGLPTSEQLGPDIRLTRLDVDRRITSGLRPLPEWARTIVARAIGLDPLAVILPASEPRGMNRITHPVRRMLELVAHVRRVGPWTDAVVTAAPVGDIFHTMALPALPVVRAAARRIGGRYVYDIADYQTEAGRLARLPGPVRAGLRRRERQWARSAAGLLAVSNPIAILVAKQFGVQRPRVLLNCPSAWRAGEAGAPTSTRLRDALRLPTNRPVIVHQGQFKLDRGIEELVHASDHPQLRELDAAIVFIGYGRLEAYLEEAAKQRPGRIFVLPPVPPDQLIEWISGANVAYLGCPPRTLNLRLTLPNKLFECIMAGVPVVAAEGTEQGRLVSREAVGRTADIEAVDSLAGELSAILTMPANEQADLRQHCRSLALTRYSWELNAEPLIELYRELANDAATRTAPEE
jgi:glycosyltransferase involved in cell wall biosynthesis